VLFRATVSMGRKGLLLACGMLGLVALVVPARASSKGVPDWVRDAAQQVVPAYNSNTRAVVLLSEITYTVAPNGRASEHVRYVVKILRPQGRRDATPVVWYDKSSKLDGLHVWSIDPAGHEYALKDEEVLDLDAGESFELYSDDRMKVASPPGRDPGGVIAWEYTRNERPYVKETTWDFQNDLPRLKQVFTLALPAGYTYSTTWAHHPLVDGADLENHSYRWEMNNESPIDLEHVPFSPAGSSLSGRMTVHYSAPGDTATDTSSWKGVGLWFDGLAHDRMASNPEMAAKAAALTAGKTDFFDKAEAIGEYVQKNIRYVAIEIGIGGNQPHPAADIFKSGYGDCKDKATLLSAMLSTVGIHSSLVIVDTSRGVIDPDDPSVSGNHAIGAIEIPAGYESPRLHSVVTAKTGKRYLIFDPTWDQTPFGQLEDNLQGGYAMLMEGADSQVIRLPVMAPDLNRVQRTASFVLSADGTLQGSVTEKRFGDVAERRRVLARSDAKMQQENMDRLMALDFSSLALTGLTFEDATSLNRDVVTSFHLQAQNFATATGPLLMLRPRVFGTYGLNVDRKSRKVPIDLHETMQGHDEFDIALPAGYAVDEMPQPVKLDWGFASYESKTEVHGRTLHYSRTFTLRDVTLPAAKYHDLQDLAATIGEDEGGQVVLKRVAEAVKGSGTAVAH
jgi:hypothetical protein